MTRDLDRWNLGRRVLLGLAVFGLFHLGFAAAVWWNEREAWFWETFGGGAAGFEGRPRNSPAATCYDRFGDAVGLRPRFDGAAWATGRVVRSLTLERRVTRAGALRSLREAAWLPGLTNLSTVGGFPEDVTAAVADLPHLRRWAIVGVHDVSRHLAVAETIPTLRVLVLQDATLTPADVAALRGLRQVVTVVLLDCDGEPLEAVRAAMPWAIVAASDSRFDGLREENLR